MKILLADDHAVLRVGLIRILSEEFPAAQFAELIQPWTETQP